MLDAQSLVVKLKSFKLKMGVPKLNRGKSKSTRKDFKQSLMFCFICRELFRGTTDKPKIKNVFAKRSLLKTRGLSAKKVRRQMVSF
jgi:hypothetical protein